MSILDIDQLGCHIATYRGFVTLSTKGTEIQRLPFEHIDAVITKAHGITYSHNLFVQLAQRNIPLVISDRAFLPVSIVLPLGAHHATARQVAAQAEATMGQKNLLWQALVQRKIMLQAAVLSANSVEHSLLDLVKQVNSGDRHNVEAQAARKYWTLLFAPSFIRDRYGDATNQMLNYGYTVFRAALAREVCATGLHPALGIHHKHPRNNFCLIDDLIEPYRPLVDYCVKHCLKAGEQHLNPSVKTLLVEQLKQRVRVGTKWVCVEDSMRLLAQSVSLAYRNKTTTLKLPKPDLTGIEIDL